MYMKFLLIKPKMLQLNMNVKTIGN